MTYSQELLTTFKKWNDDVKLGDDGELDVKGRGSVQIKMYGEMIRTLDAWWPGSSKRTRIDVVLTLKNFIGYQIKRNEN